jgi:hypothetical protein
MANESNTKARPALLIRADDSVPGVVRFYDRREADVQKALIGSVNVVTMGNTEGSFVPPAIARAAVHGITQNILDASNKLTGDERVAFIARACETVQAGGWASAPVDEEAAIKKAVKALMALGMTLEAATAIAAQRA